MNESVGRAELSSEDARQLAYKMLVRFGLFMGLKWALIIGINRFGRRLAKAASDA